MSRWLIIDQGSHASRACLVDDDHTITGEARRPIEMRKGDGGRAEHDPEALLNSVTECVDEVMSQANRAPEACGLITQRSTIACWDGRDRTALAPLLSWQDTRAALPPLDPEQLHRITGLRPSRHYGAAKMRWCLDHVPEVQRAAREGALRMGPLAAWLLANLCPDGPTRVDPCNAARTLLFDIDRGDWSPDLLAAFGLDRDWLPEPVPCNADFGTLSTRGARIPMRLLSGDQSVVPYAAGPVSSGRAWLQLGTGAFLQAPAETAAAGLLRSRVGLEGEQAMVEATVNGCGAAVSAACGSLGIDETGCLAAADAGIGSPELPLYLNGVGGLGSPDWLSDFPSRWLQPATPEPVPALAAVLESIAFLIRRNLDRMPPLQVLVAGGGLARLDGLCQGLADLCRVTVLRPMEAEAGILGAAALLSGRRDGLRPPATRFEPRSGTSLERRYRDWTRYMPHS